MKILILTQKDNFFIPKNIKLLSDVPELEMIGVYVVSTSGSLNNKKSYFLRGFGVSATLKYAFKIISQKLEDFHDRLTCYKKYFGTKSIKSICRCEGIPLRTIINPNGSSFIKEVREMDLDLIISFSAPVVFKPTLLSLPRHGCINLHCSLLPKYAGIFPSFWVILNDEKYTGSTVHFMDDRIDNGKIIIQQKILIHDQMTIFDLIKETKRIGGDLMVTAIKRIKNNEDNYIKNDSTKGSYHSWPLVDDFRLFKSNGKKFIK